MKRGMPAFAALALSGVAFGNVATFDMSNIESRDFLGDPNNLSFYLVPTIPNVTLTNISWDITLTTFDVSWADEATISFHNSLGLISSVIPGSGDAFSVSNMNYSGSTAMSMILSLDDPVIMEFHETGFDDLPDQADAIYGPGSWIRLSNAGGKSFDIEIVPIPASAVWLPLALGGLFVSNRRRLLLNRIP